jgi:hypothetical protein
MRRGLGLAAAVAALVAGCGADDEPNVDDVPDLRNEAAEEAFACLEGEGYDVIGFRSEPSDRDAPDIELTLSLGSGQAFVAYYASVAEAAKREPELHRNAEDFAGTVLRRGSVAIVIGGHAEDDDRTTIENCVF